MGDKDDYLTSYRVFFENFAANVDPEDQLPVNIAGYTITEAELPGEVIYWTTQYLSEKECPLPLMTPLQRIILDEVRVASKQYPNEYGFDADISEYVALRLMQAVTARVNDVCLRYLDNARLDTLPPPPPPERRDFPTAASVTKNLRRVMEDRHFEIGNLEALFGIETTEPTSFYGVYDGHAGSAAAVYCAAHLHQYLVESPHFTKDLRRALEDAFLRTDAEFIRKSNQKRVSGGSTAVVVCVRGRRLVAAWAGDSLALLAKRLKLMQLVHPHKPNRPDEKERIEATGGKVRFWGTWRVNGQLAVSRAIGDAQYKPYVTAQPEVAEVELDGDEDFVVVACDGLWDFVSEDVVALVVYKQIVTDPNDLKEVTKNLVRQAKRQGSQDNISVIVVFLKEPREIAAENTTPMEIGLDNAVVNPPPFSVENDVCKVSDNGGGCADVDNDVSDSDSDDLGPETAVDVELDELDADERHDEPAAPTPPAHAVEDSHIDGNLVDNVAESGEESEDEWNYYKGEGERDQNPAEEADEVLRSETPGQDNSAWESSSVDMNSSPLNPDAPVFVPGSVAGCDQLLAESPRKPLPMDDIELPDVAQFQTEAHIRPAELHDLDNCDHLNGHHNLSMEGVTEHLNGNGKNNLDSLGFGFGVGIEQDKIKDTSLIQDFERIQKDTTDFCNIQVFQAHETNPFSLDADDQLLERLKNKERDPMSMSFYQEKDDDTCDRFNKSGLHVDLNAVQPLPESDDDDIPTNGVCQGVRDNEKENINPEYRDSDILDLDNNQEPNNDIMRFEDNVEANNFVDFNVDATNNMQNYTNTDFECNLQQETVAHTDTPESHKLLFEQIPEIPDGKSSELGFTNEDLLDPSESEKDARVTTPQDEISQDVEMDSKIDDSPSEELQQHLVIPNDIQNLEENEQLKSSHQFEDDQNDLIENLPNEEESNIEQVPMSPLASEQDEHLDTISAEVNHENIVVDVHHISEPQQNGISDEESQGVMASEDLLSNELSDKVTNESPLPRDSPIEESLLTSVYSKDTNILSRSHESPSPMSPVPADVALLSESPRPQESPLTRVTPLDHDSLVPHDTSLLGDSPLPLESPVDQESLLPCESQVTSESPLPSKSPVPSESPLPCESLIQPEVLHPRESPIPQEALLGQDSLLLNENSLARDSPLPSASPRQVESPCSSPLPTEPDLLQTFEVSATKSPLLSDNGAVDPYVPNETPIPFNADIELESSSLNETARQTSPVPAEIPLPRESPNLSESPLPEESQLCGVDEFSQDKNQADSLIEQSPIESQENICIDNEPKAELIESQQLLATEKDIESINLLAQDEMSIESLKENNSQNLDMHIEKTGAQDLVGSALIGGTVPSDISPSPVQDGITSQAVEFVASPIPTFGETISQPTESNELLEAPLTEASAPTPDIVPEGHSRTELVTDIDIGIPESRAQEICVPVTSEIQANEEIQPGATPPPTPAVEAMQGSTEPLGDAPIAAPLAGAAVGAAAVAAAGAAIAKTKSGSPKKAPSTAASKTTPKPSSKAAPASTRTPASATKRPVSATTTPRSPATVPARPATARTPASASKASAPAKPTSKSAAPSPKPVASPTTPVAKTTVKPSQAVPAARSTAAPRPAAPRAAPKPSAPKPSAPTAPKPASAPAAKATAPAPRAAPRPAPIRAAPAPTRAPLSSAPPKLVKDLKPKAPEAKKPLTNGDVKASAKPATARAPAARPAPRPAPRVPSAAPAPTKAAAPKAPVRAALDKQSKDLANKRITAKAAPPRTATAKVPPTTKSAPKPITKRVAEKKPALNGDAPHKPPPSPPAADNALLPDVIA